MKKKALFCSLLISIGSQNAVGQSSLEDLVDPWLYQMYLNSLQTPQPTYQPTYQPRPRSYSSSPSYEQEIQIRDLQLQLEKAQRDLRWEEDGHGWNDGY